MIASRMRADASLAAALLAVGLLAAAPRAAAAQTVVGCDCYCGVHLSPPYCTDRDCVNACGGSSGGQTYEPRPMNIAWGGMTKRVNGMIEECGPKPACKMFRATFLYPLAFMFDGPYYAIKGVGYGLYYVGVGLAKGTAATGRGIASPFRKAAERSRAVAYSGAADCSGSVSGAHQSPAVWESCKRNILRRQKALTKQDSSNKENERWCRKNIPLDSGPNRFNWETRCNPGVTAVLIQPPFSDTATAPPTATSAQMTTPGMAAPAPVAAPAAPAAPSVAAAPEAATSAGAASLPTAAEAGAEAAAAQAEIDKRRAQGAPAESAPGSPAPATPSMAPSSLPESGTPALRDPATLQGKGLDEAKAAGGGAFDTKGAMLGKAGTAGPLPPSGLVGATPASAGPDGRAPTPPEPQTRGAAAAPQRSATPASSALGAPASAAARSIPAALPARANPLVESGKAKLVGDPDRFKEFFKSQTGETCAIVSVLQIAGGMGRPSTEEELFWDAFKGGLLRADTVCSDEFGKYYCAIEYDPATEKCRNVDSSGNKSEPTMSACYAARRTAGTTIEGMGRLLERATGKPVRNSYVPPIEQIMKETGAKNAAAALEIIEKTYLPKARAEVFESLKRGNAVMVTLDASRLWKTPTSRAMHAVVVTASVVDLEGSPIGFYINDSSTGEQARFLELKDFDRAWLGDDLQRVYVQ